MAIYDNIHNEIDHVIKPTPAIQTDKEKER